MKKRKIKTRIKILLFIAFFLISQITFKNLTFATDSLSFSDVNVYDVEDSPSNFVTGDFNKDGMSDLIVTNPHSSSISVLLGNKGGTFNKAVNYHIGIDAFGRGTFPSGIISGDFNDDGILDITVSHTEVIAFNPSGFPFYEQIASKVSVLLGNGDGTFSNNVSYTISGGYNLTTKDFNNDGYLDLSFFNYSGDSVGVLLGKGDGTFNAPKYFTVGPNLSRFTICDFNGDNKLDIAVTNCNSNCVSVLFGKGDGTFADYVDYGVGIEPGNITAGDFNGDNKMDLAITHANLEANKLTILLGKGDGTFSSIIDICLVGISPRYISTGDFNNDKNLDLVIANAATNDILILLGKGDGSFNNADHYDIGRYSSQIITEDFNNDGKLDIAAINGTYENRTFNTISILLNNSEVIPSPTPDYWCKVSGYVAPDFQTTGTSDVKKQLSVEIIGNGIHKSTTTDSKGYFEITDIPKLYTSSTIPGTVNGYTIRISKMNYLSREIKNVMVFNDYQIGSSDTPITLWAGDIIPDDAINMSDIMAIASIFNCTSKDLKFNKQRDFNMDNAINMSDIMIIAKHFNMIPTDYPAI